MSRKKLTSDIDPILLERHIKRMDPYINMLTRIRFQCLIDDCQYIWKTVPNNILNNNTGCPKCYGNIKYTNEQIDIKLIGKNIKRLDDYINVNYPIRFQCLIDSCNYIWKTNPKVIVLLNCGCPQCSGQAKLTNEIVDFRLSKLDIVRIDDVINSSTPIRFQCKKCTHIWSACPNAILNRGTGCPKCNIRTYNEKLMYSILEENNVNYQLQFPIRKIDQHSPPYRFDAFISTTNIAIEYNGKRHYQPTGFGGNNPEADFASQKLRDQYKREFCAKHNIKLIEIDGRKFKGTKLRDYMLETLIPIIKEIK